MNAISIAQAGLNAAFQRFDASARRTAQFGRADGDVDLGAEAVEQVEAKQSVEANVAVIRAADQMLGSLLDLKV